MDDLYAPSASVQLQDGRALGLMECGDRGGDALFYFHGYPGSRLEARLLSEAARRFGMRLIGVDRPGIGLSTFDVERRLLDWPADVAELADRLGIDRFSVVGWSGGGPYALACACRIPDRLVACGIVSGAGVAGPLLSSVSWELPWLLTPVIGLVLRRQERARRALRYVSRLWPEPDREVLGWSGVGETLAASFAEAFRQGSRGLALEVGLVDGDWGFKLEEVRHPALHLWHGERDEQVPVAQGRAAAARLQGCQATFYPDEGHFSLIVRRSEEIIGALAGHRERS